MKKVFLVSLLLAGIFLIGSLGTALAQCMDYQDYYCDGLVFLGGIYNDTWDDCIELCYDDGFEVGFNDYAGDNYIYGYLYPATDNKNLLGTFYDVEYYWGGASIESNGRSRILKLSYTQDGSGWVVTFNCTPCNGCCH